MIGNTNSGKSTLLNNITGMTNFFNTSQLRETSSLWTFKLDKDQSRPYRITVLEAVTDNPEETKNGQKVSPNSSAFKIEYRAKEIQEFDTKEDLIVAIQSKKNEDKKVD